MVELFIENYAKKLATHPHSIKVEKSDRGDEVEIILFSSQEDMGKFIGKNGKMIYSLKNILSGCRVKDGKNYKIAIQPI
ncbi:KH domain-containing protein [Helicobacter kayseriensis]|uniref:KH domain-containing protein n=1 Tax=Helicobacter kayseriensis TaxID=2905877 RepID=UPI001E57D330|nr:KH domain-containing protein [Helicobacter kayseriensis]MCE3047702.1 KH domain-containing protein [Helicobacter kayseriensis]MCE3049060.1 KH domain-containing protein [Helicobacter kayseriensis]